MNVTVVSYKDVFGDKWVDHVIWSPTTHKKQNKWIRGAVYRLRTKATVDSSLFDGVSDKFYKLITPVKQIGELKNFNGLVMKQIGGDFNPDAKKFSLSPQQCEMLHIKYEPNLEMYSSERGFERIIRKIPYDKIFSPEDLSTYPTWLCDGTIRDMLIRLDDFVYIDNKDKRIFNTKTGKYYKITDNKQFNFWNIGGVKIINNFSLQTSNKKLIYKKGEELVYDVLESEIVKKELNGNKNVFIKIYFNVGAQGCFTEDGIIGMNTKQLTDKSFSDVFTILDEKQNNRINN